MFTARNNSCGKVMFSQVCVSHSVHLSGGVSLQEGGLPPGAGLPPEGGMHPSGGVSLQEGGLPPGAGLPPEGGMQTPLWY